MARPTLLMLPGLLATRRVFQPQIDALSDTVDIVIPELWHYDSMAAMADAALAMAPPRFALAGFSMGGYVAFEVMRRAADRVERLALIDTQATPDAAEATARRHGLMEQTKIGRFHGVQPSLLPMILHSSHIDNKAIAERIVSAPVSPLGQRFHVKTKDAAWVASPTTLGVDPARIRRKALVSATLGQ